MPQPVATALKRVRSIIAGFTLAQRTIAVIGLAVLALGIVALVSWLARPAYTPLFSGLSAADANAVVEQLRSSSVPYQLTDGGSTVLVPEQDVYDQRLAAASAGLPTASSGGYTLLDKMGVTASEFQQSVTYKRAIEGELAATISSMDGVSAASVKLAIPEESVFVSETKDPTASVFVELRNRSTLSPQKVEAIVHLTSAAVTGLKPENVAVVDQTGRTLSAVGVGATGGIDEQAGDYEGRVAASVQKMLDTVVGVGNATVTVAADIDRSSNQRQDETYSPAEGAPPASEQTKTQTSKDGSTGAGVLGPDNIAVPSGGSGGESQTTEVTRNNVVNKSVQTTTTPAGALRRQSVSVAVDAAAAGTVDAAQLQSLVATAAGIDTTRGDAVTVAFVNFSQTEAKAAQDALKAARDAADAERAAALRNTIIVAAAIAVPALVALILLVVRRRRARDDQDEILEYVPLLDGRPRSLAGPAAVPAEAEPVARLEFTEPSEPARPEPELEPLQADLERHRRDLGALARRDPQRTAELLRALLYDGQEA